MILTWFILAILVGVYASNKGKSFLGYFFIAALLSPLVGFIIVFVSKDSTAKEQPIIIEKESVSDELLKLNELKEKGILSEEEFNEQKKKLLKQ
tara:strand:- start:34 stop:315 length:282 start_codon:yes stop_codon:yes gene_type:complete